MTATYDPSAASELTGLTLDTLRYYEREGLIGPVERRSGKRVYSGDDVAWISVVTCLRDAGLGISDIRGFTELLRAQTGPHDRVAFLRDRRAELVARLANTQAAIDVLDEKIEYYSHSR